MPRPLPPVSRDAINGELLRQLPGHDPRTIKVEVRTLDTWSAKHEPGPIDFIWADIEGAARGLVARGHDRPARYPPGTLPAPIPSRSTDERT
ncbi:MAG: FkbM family methyltransferase, partial [Planctomycetes bacterium]|nr:FkbM family methyltransferase [Planctomycetota bacterium]